MSSQSRLIRSNTTYVTAMPGRRISIRLHNSGKSGVPSSPKATSSPSNVLRLVAGGRVRRVAGLSLGLQAAVLTRRLWGRIKAAV